MVWECAKCKSVWYYPVERCIYCKGETRELKSKNCTVVGITKVNVPSKDHSQVPYYDLLLEDESGNLHLKKSFKEYSIGDKIKDGPAEHTVKTIGIIGTGITGIGIAQITAQAGHRVILKSRTTQALEKAFEKIGKNLLRSMAPAEKDKILGSIKATTDYRDLAKADIIIESVAENEDIKKEVYTQLNKIISDKTIIATNTSSLSIDEMAKALSNPRNFVGMHFFNPVTKMRLVEVVKGSKTSNAALKEITELSKQLSKVPIGTADSPCFIVNRMLAPYLNEAICELYEGVASVQEIDEAAKMGLNHPIGPLALADMIGLDIVLEIIKSMYKRTKNNRYTPCPLLEEMVTRGKLGRKTCEGFYKYGK